MATIGSISPAGPARQAPKAFTLVELLVVVSVIILLVGIIMPHLLGTEQVANRTVCVSNLRQVGFGVKLYRDAHNAMMPQVQSFPVDRFAPSIMKVLEEQVQSKDVWRCPNDPELFPLFGTSYEYYIGFYYQFANIDKKYAIQNNEDLGRFFRKNEDIVVVMLDGAEFHPTGPPGVTKNALYLDGHVDWFNPGTPESSGGNAQPTSSGGSK